MDTAQRVVQLIEKKRLSVNKAANLIGLKESNLQSLFDGKYVLSTDELVKISEYFNVSLDYLLKGTMNLSDKETVEALVPDENQYAEDYIALCKLTIQKCGLQRFEKILVPEPVFYEKKGVSHFVNFQSGVFLNKTRAQWVDCYLPYLDYDKLISLDNVEIYQKLKDYPRTLGQLKYALRKINDIKGLKLLDNRINMYDKTKEEPIPLLSIDDALKMSDIWFYEYISKNLNDQTKSVILYKIKKENPNYWAIMSMLIDNGAYLVRAIENNVYGNLVQIEDVPATKMLKKLCSQLIN
jgi:plasmid maintenance system antidote protein VapI